MHPGTDEGASDTGLFQFDGPGRDFLFTWQGVSSEDDGTYQRLEADSLPFCAEYEGSVEEFLASDAGQVWRETILPMCQTNYESAGVILTDNLESMFSGRSLSWIYIVPSSQHASSRKKDYLHLIRLLMSTSRARRKTASASREITALSAFIPHRNLKRGRSASMPTPSLSPKPPSRMLQITRCSATACSIP